jgi:hypothetical protein
MICYDIKTIIIQYVNEDYNLQQINEWVKVCEWNRQNIINQIKLKNWIDDYISITSNVFNTINTAGCYNDIKLRVLHETLNKYKYDFFQLKDDCDYVKLMLHCGNLFLGDMSLKPQYHASDTCSLAIEYDSDFEFDMDLFIERKKKIKHYMANIFEKNKIYNIKGRLSWNEFVGGETIHIIGIKFPCDYYSCETNRKMIDDTIKKWKPLV